MKPYFDEIPSKAISMGIGEYPTKIAGGNRDDFWSNVDKKISNGRTPFTVRGVSVKNGQLLAGINLYVSFRNPNDELPGMILAQLNLSTKTIILP